MLEPERIESEIKPSTFENLGNGNWYYNYDIRSEEVMIPSIEKPNIEILGIRYSYIQIKMSGKPDYKRCVEHIIRKYITQSQEFDLINSYNQSMLQSQDNTLERQKYIDYLNTVRDIKNKVKADFS